MKLLAPWSSADVVYRLMFAATNTASRLAILKYFVSRSPRITRTLPRFASNTTRTVRFAELPAPLQCDRDSGGMAIYYEIITRRVYSPTPDWAPAAGELVIDVGANIGVFSMWASGLTGPQGRVVAFEPNPLAGAMLERNVAPLRNVEVRQVACGDQPASLALHYPPGRLSVGSFEQRPDRTETVVVEVVRLDDALASVEGRIAMLKIDVEGHEAPVLRGAVDTLRRTEKVVLEVAGADLDECESLLSTAGLHRVGVLAGMWNAPPTRVVIAYFER